MQHIFSHRLVTFVFSVDHILQCAGGEFRSRDEQAFLCLLPLKSADESLDFLSPNGLPRSPLLCLNVDMAESKLIFFYDAVNASIVGLLRYHSGFLNSASISHFQKQFYHKPLKFDWRQLHHFVHQLAG